MKFKINRILFINSYACNFNCPYCMVMDAKKNKDITPKMQFGFERGKNILKQVIENSPYEEFVITFSGGEPLIFFEKFIKPMVLFIEENFSNKKIRCDMFTNGSLLTEEHCTFFAAHNFKVCISYDGGCAQKYRDKETENLVLEKIKMALEIMPKNLFSIASTFYKDTLENIYDAFESVAELGIKKWSFAIDTLSTGGYSLNHCETFYKQAKLVWDNLPYFETECNTFDKIKDFHNYAESNRSILCRPNGEINIGTTVPVLIPEEFFSYFTIGHDLIEEDLYEKYINEFEDFAVHVQGKNLPIHCESCLVKQDCQTNNRTKSELKIRSQLDPMHCLYYYILSAIINETDIL